MAEKMFNIVSHKGNVIKIALGFHLISVRMAIRKTNAG
jgi:hypothetical protein